jgi:putative hydrolase of the HAD superfamily
VSDGHLEVQRRKVDALGLAAWVDAVVLTDEFGRDLWKPHPHAFRECCARLGVFPGDVVVVGDNPERDMRGARAATLPSIRIKRPDGYYSRFPAAPGDEADWEIASLDELLPLLEA